MRAVHLMFGTLVEGLVEAKRELLEGRLEQGKVVYKVCLNEARSCARGALIEARRQHLPVAFESECSFEHSNPCPYSRFHFGWRLKGYVLYLS